jgi:hypothetical protein
VRSIVCSRSPNPLRTGAYGRGQMARGGAYVLRVRRPTDPPERHPEPSKSEGYGVGAPGGVYIPPCGCYTWSWSYHIQAFKEDTHDKTH